MEVVLILALKQIRIDYLYIDVGYFDRLPKNHDHPCQTNANRQLISWRSVAYRNFLACSGMLKLEGLVDGQNG
jgi:hypothetical protein